MEDGGREGEGGSGTAEEVATSSPKNKRECFRCVATLAELNSFKMVSNRAEAMNRLEFIKIVFSFTNSAAL